jgi:hypothetical protein
MPTASSDFLIAQNAQLVSWSRIPNVANQEMNAFICFSDLGQ